MSAPETRRMAKLYFKFDSGKLAKDMAARIRNQNSFCNIIDQAHFRDEGDVDPCQLVLIQKTAPKAKLIAATYAKFGNDGVQVVFFDDDGQVVANNEPEPEPEVPAATTRPVAEDAGADTDADTGADGPASVSEGDPEGGTDEADDDGIPVE